MYVSLSLSIYIYIYTSICVYMPRMSTYLLAFCVGDLEFVSGRTQAGVLVRILACPGNAHRCSYALKALAR